MSTDAATTMPLKKYKVIIPGNDTLNFHIDRILLYNGDIINIIDESEDEYTFEIQGKKGKYILPKAQFHVDYIVEVDANNNSTVGGKRRKHRKTRHRKMKRSKTLKRKVRR